MYKVFFNDNVLNIHVSAQQNLQQEGWVKWSEGFDWQPILTRLRKDESIEINVYSGQLMQSWEDFRNQFEWMEAAGGLVLNRSDEILFIHRLNKWDLPKGKLEKGESPREGAIREVEEECGISSPKIISSEFATYHTYSLADRHILKKTWWYKMYYGGSETLVPQSEEDISKAEWKKKHELLEVHANTYPSIELVLDFYGFGNKE